MNQTELQSQKEIIAMQLYKDVYLIRTKSGSGGYNADQTANSAVDSFNKRFEFIDSTDGD